MNQQNYTVEQVRFRDLEIDDEFTRREPDEQGHPPVFQRVENGYKDGACTCHVSIDDPILDQTVYRIVEKELTYGDLLPRTVFVWADWGAMGQTPRVKCGGGFISVSGRFVADCLADLTREVIVLGHLDDFKKD